MKKKSCRKSAALKIPAGKRDKTAKTGKAGNNHKSAESDKSRKHGKKHSSFTAQPAGLSPWTSLQERRDQLAGIRPSDSDPYRFAWSL